ncbi:hypothetical protein JW710_04880, partial [Candidatus Dojkabacteria bacterium]|nr:hypothetical protein [Candidatus Dojkabacteria bacterium]
MSAKNQKLFILFVITLASVILTFRESFAIPTVEILVNPNAFDVTVGSDPIPLTVQLTEPNLQFEWTLLGPGDFEGNTATPVVFYKPPNKIDGKSTKAIATVKITDANGQEMVTG